MWRVAWVSLLTGYASHGEYCLSKGQAQRVAAHMNVKYIGQIHHWIEEKPDAAAEDTTLGPAEPDVVVGEQRLHPDTPAERASLAGGRHRGGYQPA